MAINVEAHITGTIRQVRKQKGDMVSAGDVLLVIESMKMQMPLEVEEGGRVDAIQVRIGQPVSEGDVVAVLTAS